MKWHVDFAIEFLDLQHTSIAKLKNCHKNCQVLSVKIPRSDE